MRMKIRRLLWLLAGILLIIILVEGPKEKKQEKIQDGTYHNAYLITLKEEQMTVLAEGKRWTIPCPVGKEVEKENQIVDITVEKGKITGIVWKEGQVSDQIEAIDAINGWVKLKGYGTLPLSQGWKAYQVKEKTAKEIIAKEITETGSLINWDKVQVIAIDGQVEAVLAGEEPETKYIKVLIHGEKDGIYHNQVRLTASAEYEVTQGDTTTTYGAGQEFVLSKEESDDTKNSDSSNADSCQITCKSGRIRLLSLDQTSGYPEYRGKILVHKEENGYVVRNELLLEQYLYSVVSSEMPSEYPKEALKAQAICARTYALYQMNRSFYSPYGANVDDTVNSQVYNNIAETKESRDAVKATQEQYMEYDNKPIAAYFYSTSCGFTSDAGDVWIGEGENPSYLKGHFQGKSDNRYDLSTEAAFLDFIEKEPEDAFEKGEPWFRWNVTISLSEISDSLNQHLADWIKENPSYFILKEKEDRTEKNQVENNQTEKNQVDNDKTANDQSEEVVSIGMITDISVEKRSKGGVIKELLVKGEQGNVCIIGEYQIRKALCPKGTEVTLKDSNIHSCTILPSAFFSLQLQDGKMNLTGGGYGHGVGLSQNGAKAMANLDYGYEDILDFYYPGVTLVYGY